MGKIKYMNQVMDLFKKSPVVGFASIKKVVKSEAYAKLVIHNLTVQKRIFRIAKGVYTIHDNPELAIFALQPAYFGLQDALSFHNLWEQETIPVIVTARRVRAGLRTVLGSNVLVKRLDKKLLFGYDYVQRGNLAYPYATVEKTLIDMLYFKEHLDKKVFKTIMSQLNRKKLHAYLKKYDAKMRKRVRSVLPV